MDSDPFEGWFLEAGIEFRRGNGEGLKASPSSITSTTKLSLSCLARMIRWPGDW